MKRVLIAAVVALLALAGTAPAADFGDGANQRFQFELGGAMSSFDTSASLTVSRGGVLSGGTAIDFEKLLDLPIQDTHFKGVAQWRFSGVSYLQVGYESIAREGQRVLDGSISWGDVTYSANAKLDGHFDTDEIYFGYRWDAFKADNVRLGFTVGFSYLTVDAALAGNGQVTKPDGTVETGAFVKGFDIAAPVPVLGLVAEGAISSKVSFGFYFRTLFISLSEFSGGILQGGLKGKWYITPHFGVGGGVDVSAIQIRKYVDEPETYTAKYSYAGPSLFLIAAF